MDAIHAKEVMNKYGNGGPKATVVNSGPPMSVPTAVAMKTRLMAHDDIKCGRAAALRAYAEATA